MAGEEEKPVNLKPSLDEILDRHNKLTMAEMIDVAKRVRERDKQPKGQHRAEK